MNLKNRISSVFEAQFFHMGHCFHLISSLTDIPSIRLLQDGQQPSNYLEDHPETYVLSTLNPFKFSVAFFLPQFKLMHTCSSVKTTSF